MMNLITQVEKSRGSLSVGKDTLVATHNTWDRDKDARITLFSKCINVLNSTQLGMTFIQFQLTNKQWWKSISKGEIPDRDIQIYVKEFGMFVKLGLLQFLFSSIESSFRLFVKCLDPNACNGGTAEFKSIYSYLLARLNLQQWETLLDLLRCIRNTVHNNGVYFHRSGNNEIVVHNRITYSFIIGKPVDFATWEFLLNLLNDVEKMLLAVVNSPEVASIPMIVDPFAP